MNSNLETMSPQNITETSEFPVKSWEIGRYEAKIKRDLQTLDFEDSLGLKRKNTHDI